MTISNSLHAVIIGVFLFISTFTLQAQQVNKKYVVFEIATGTWCSYCPAAANGADEMVEAGYQVAVIENHGSDAYNYQGSNLRNAYYVNTSFPSTTFNGLDKFIGGGDASSSNFSTYLEKYNDAISVLSDFTIDLSVLNSSIGVIVNIDITEPGNFTGTNLSIHLIVTESHISESWEGLDELNFVSRAMYPDYQGTSFTGGTRSINVIFSPESTWNLEKCEVIAFIQDNTTKEILQTDKKPIVQTIEVETNVLDRIKVYPNPTKDNVVIKGAKDFSISIYNILGKLVYFKNSISAFEKMNLEKMNKGIYILKFSKDSKTISKKLIIN